MFKFGDKVVGREESDHLDAFRNQPKMASKEETIDRETVAWAIGQ